jgi:hypothetical protein
MNLIQIPFNYKGAGDYLGYLMHNTFNQGIILCKRLGFNPIVVEVGKEEWKQMSLFEPPLERVLDLVIIPIEEPSALNFLCEPYDFRPEKA